MGYVFEWDPAKADANARKHGVTFDKASTAFGGSAKGAGPTAIPCARSTTFHVPCAGSLQPDMCGERTWWSSIRRFSTCFRTARL